MKKQTLPNAFAELRKKVGLTMLETANKCDLAETTVWKIENGKSIRWETVHLVLAVAFNVQPGTSTYESFNHLWLKARQEMAESQTEDFAQTKASLHAVAAVRKFRKQVSDLDETECRYVVDTVNRAIYRLSEFGLPESYQRLRDAAGR